MTNNSIHHAPIWLPFLKLNECKHSQNFVCLLDFFGMLLCLQFCINTHKERFEMVKVNLLKMNRDLLSSVSDCQTARTWLSKTGQSSLIFHCPWALQFICQTSLNGNRSHSFLISWYCFPRWWSSNTSSDYSNAQETRLPSVYFYNLSKQSFQVRGRKVPAFSMVQLLAHFFFFAQQLKWISRLESIHTIHHV